MSSMIDGRTWFFDLCWRTLKQLLCTFAALPCIAAVKLRLAASSGIAVSATHETLVPGIAHAALTWHDVPVREACARGPHQRDLADTARCTCCARSLCTRPTLPARSRRRRGPASRHEPRKRREEGRDQPRRTRTREGTPLPLSDAGGAETYAKATACADIGTDADTDASVTDRGYRPVLCDVAPQPMEPERQRTLCAGSERGDAQRACCARSKGVLSLLDRLHADKPDGTDRMCTYLIKSARMRAWSSYETLESSRRFVASVTCAGGLISARPSSVQEVFGSQPRNGKQARARSICGPSQDASGPSSGARRPRGSPSARASDDRPAAAAASATAIGAVASRTPRRCAEQARLVPRRSGSYYALRHCCTCVSDYDVMAQHGLRVCVCVYVHVCVCVCMYVYTYVYTHIHTHAHQLLRVHTHSRHNPSNNLPRTRRQASLTAVVERHLACTPPGTLYIFYFFFPQIS